jgi:hypothetical protein
MTKQKKTHITSLGTVAGVTKTQTTQVRQKTYIAIVLDNSGSMNQIRQQAINYFNETLSTIQGKARETNQDIVVSLVTFGHNIRSPTSPWTYTYTTSSHSAGVANLPNDGAIRVRQWNVTADQVVPLTWDSYVPEANTPLYQALGETIERLEQVPDRDNANVAFLVNVITDGQENDSRGKYSVASALSALVGRLQETKKWTFTVQGANINLTDLARMTGIYSGNMASFTATAAGTAAASHTHSISTGEYITSRGSGATFSSGFYQAAKNTNSTNTDPKSK